jgi:tetratricopeptide (TPR) repeat protein
MRPLTLLTRLLPTTLLLAAPFVSAGQTPPATQPLDDPLESLSARATRGEGDEDHLDALAHFSAGRVLQQRQQFKQALRQYERALRLDDAAGPALRDLVPLAFAAGRNDEGLRYLVKYAEQSTIEPELLEQAADYIADSGDWKGAIRLDERALAETKNAKPSPEQVLLNLQLGRLYALTEQDREAAMAFKRVMEALEDPDKFGLDAKQRKNLLGDGGANYELMGSVFLEAKRIEDAKRAFENGSLRIGGGQAPGRAGRAAKVHRSQNAPTDNRSLRIACEVAGGTEAIRSIAAAAGGNPQSAT